MGKNEKQGKVQGPEALIFIQNELLRIEEELEIAFV